jgi:translation elongation factor EF-Tu-like GTPase
MSNGRPYAEVFVQFLAAEAGGRSGPIVLNESYRPHFRVGEGELLGVSFVDGPDDPVNPGSGTLATVQFLYARAVNYDVLQIGTRFCIVEGSRIVGVGYVTRRA